MLPTGRQRSRRRPRDRSLSQDTPPADVSGEAKVHRGYLKWFNERKGYGFIHCPNGTEVFVHQSAVVLGSNDLPLAKGCRVEFELRHTPRGRQACNVVVLGNGPAAEDQQPPVEEVSSPALDLSEQFPSSWRRKPSAFVYTCTIYGRRNG